MALVIENGSIVANANSYVTLVEARAYATARGKPLPTDDTAAEALLISAMDYLESKRGEYQGSKVSPDQTLQFPRYDVYIDNFLFSENSIPSILKQAQIRLAMEANAGVDLMPTRTSGQFVKREKIGPIDTEYSEAIGSGLAPELLAVDALLQPLFNNSGGFFLKTIRV